MSDIDFEEASCIWRQNKKELKYSPGAFEYVCGFIKENGKVCKAPPKAFKKQFRKEFKYTWSFCVEHSKYLH